MVLRLPVIIVKFQTWDKQLRCLPNISKLTWPPGSPSIPWSLLQGMTAISPPSTLTSPSQGLDNPSSRGSSLYNSTILVTHPLLYLWPPACCTWFLSLHLSFSLPTLHKVQGHVHAGLSQMSLLLATNSLVSTINLFLHHI